MNLPKKVVVLVSGRGTNLQALIDHCKQSKTAKTAKMAKIAKISEVISSNKDAYALTRAKEANIKCSTLPTKRDDRDIFLFNRLEELKPDLIVLAGYMKIVPGKIVKHFKNKIINIHPALLPSFPGLTPQKQAIDHGAKVSGCTVHFVDEGVDSGPIILQQSVEIVETDTADSLAEKILPHEHRLLVNAVDLFCNERIRIEGRRVYII